MNHLPWLLHHEFLKTNLDKAGQNLLLCYCTLLLLKFMKCSVLSQGPFWAAYLTIFTFVDDFKHFVHDDHVTTVDKQHSAHNNQGLYYTIKRN